MTKDLSREAIQNRFVEAIEKEIVRRGTNPQTGRVNRALGKKQVAKLCGTTTRNVGYWLGEKPRPKNSHRSGSAGRRKSKATGRKVGTLPRIELLALACDQLGILVSHIIIGDDGPKPTMQAVEEALLRSIARQPVGARLLRRGKFVIDGEQLFDQIASSLSDYLVMIEERREVMTRLGELYGLARLHKGFAADQAFGELLIALPSLPADRRVELNPAQFLGFASSLVPADADGPPAGIASGDVSDAPAPAATTAKRRN